MMHKLLIVIFCMSVLDVTAQTEPVPHVETIAESFIPHVSFVDSAKNTYYCIGRYEPKGYQPVLNHMGEWVLLKMTDSENQDYDHHLAPIFLRIHVVGEQEKYYPLNDVHDIESYRFLDLPSKRFIIIAGRYSLHVYDTDTESLSGRLVPAKDQYEGEDAISGTLSGLSFFDDEQFLFGHVQAYGIFCYELSDPTRPKELRRLALSEDNNNIYFDNKGKYHLFLHPKENKLWDVLIACSDIASESRNINQLYTRFKDIRYALQDISIQVDQQGEPMVNIASTGVIHIPTKNGTKWLINLFAGEVLGETITLSNDHDY